jgi:hypothetical protein
MYDRTVRLLKVIASSLVLAACGLDVVGVFSASSDGGASSSEAGEGVDGRSGDATIGDGAGANDANVDAGPKCDSGHYVDALTAIDASTWFITHDGSNGDHPKIDPTAEGPAVSLISPNAGYSLGAIWLTPPVDIRAFDLSFRYLMTCPDAGGCSDGIAAAWIEATDAGQSALSSGTSASTFALPPGGKGGAVLFDVHTDTGTGDRVTPSVTFAVLDGRTPGQYDWHADAGPEAGTGVSLEGDHDVTIRVRSGVAEVTIDGVLVTRGPVPTDFTGWIGLSASTGAEVGQFAVRNFDARFYVCDAP